MKNSVDEFNHRLDTIKERINKQGDSAVEMVPNAAERKRAERITGR